MAFSESSMPNEKAGVDGNTYELVERGDSGDGRVGRKGEEKIEFEVASIANAIYEKSMARD
jgi:hypothetical protein